MVPFISPRVPSNRVSYSATPPARRPFWNIRVVRWAIFLFLIVAISELSFSSVLAHAPRTVAAETFLEVHKWWVIGGSATFFVQAILIIWLLFTRTRRHEAEIESQRF